jgi:mannitol/fructose-specific phosphotransferase system IIA component (Ntr-type)
VAPTVTQHLAVLSRISRLLRAPRLRQLLMSADSPKTVIALLRDAENAA